MKQIIIMSMLALMPWFSKAQTYIIIIGSAPASGGRIYSYPNREHPSPVQERRPTKVIYDNSQFDSRYNGHEYQQTKYPSRMYADNDTNSQSDNYESDNLEEVNYEPVNYNQRSGNGYLNTLKTVERTVNTLSQIFQLYQQGQEIKYYKQQNRVQANNSIWQNQR